MTPDATEVYLKEYEQALGTYKFTYQTIWQAGSIFISASAAIAAIAWSGGGGVDHHVRLVALVPYLFWWLGVFRPMNRYGEIHSDRAADLEAILNKRVPDLTMNHFTKFNSRKRDKGLKRLKSFKWVRKPRVSEVVNTVGILLFALEVGLIVNFLV